MRPLSIVLLVVGCNAPAAGDTADTAASTTRDEACALMFGEDACGYEFQWDEGQCHDRCQTEDPRTLDAWAECVLGAAGEYETDRYGYDGTACDGIVRECAAWPCSDQSDYETLPYCP